MTAMTTEQRSAWRMARDRQLAERAAARQHVAGNAAAQSKETARTEPKEPTIDVSAAIADAVKNERVRIRSILDAPEARGREASASSLAFETNFGSPQARKLLSTMKLDAEGTDAEIDTAARKFAETYGRRSR